MAVSFHEVFFTIYKKASGGTKLTKIETGFMVNVLFFVKGDKLIINMTDGFYVSRA